MAVRDEHHMPGTLTDATGVVLQDSGRDSMDLRFISGNAVMCIVGLSVEDLWNLSAWLTVQATDKRRADHREYNPIRERESDQWIVTRH